MRARPIVTLIALSAMLAAGRVACACAACFNDPDSPQTKGAGMAVIFMLGITGGVLTGFAIFFVYLIRRFREFGERALALQYTRREHS